MVNRLFGNYIGWGIEECIPLSKNPTARVRLFGVG